MRFSKYYLISIILTSVSACTVIPGSHQSRSSFWSGDNPPEEYVEASTEIDFININTTYLSHSANTDKSNQIDSTWTDTKISSRAVQRIKENYHYKIGPADVLTIVVWEHPELTIPAGSYRSAEESGTVVKADGTIFYPYAGDLYVEGLTTGQVKNLIADKLSSVVRDPQIDVRVAGFNSKRALVSGSVQNPGTEPITDVPVTLIEAIEQHGGLTDDADWENISLTRNNITKSVSLRTIYEDGELSQNVILKDGDVVHIPRYDHRKIFVMGEVIRPRPIFMSRNGTTLAEALSEANGINERRADGRGIYVFRNARMDIDEEGQPVYRAKVFHLDSSSAIGFAIADQFPLRARDVVYVSAAPITRWNRFMSQLLPTIIAARNIDEIQEN